MIRTIHTIRDKVIKTVKKFNKNKSSKYFGKESVILECENNNILVQQDKELISEEDLSTVFESNILLGKSTWRFLMLTNPQNPKVHSLRNVDMQSL